MSVYGTMYIAVRGPGQLLQQAAGLLRGGEETETARKMLLEGLRLQEDGRLVAFWKESREGNYRGTAGLEKLLHELENVSRSVPDLEIAIGAVTRSGDTDVWHCSSYYSPAGSDTLRPDGFANQCSTRLWTASVRIAAEHFSVGTIWYDLYDENGWVYDEIFQGAPFAPRNVKLLCNAAYEQLRSTPILLNAYFEEACRNSESDGWMLQICDTLPPDTEALLEETGVKWEDIAPYFMIPTDPWEKAPECPSEAQEKILKFLRWRYPQDDAYLDGDRCLIGDEIRELEEDKVQYFPGSWASLAFCAEEDLVDWGFPEEAKSWIPIPEKVEIPWRFR